MSDVLADLVQQAILLDRAGRRSDAARAYARILAQWPNLPDCWYNLGVLQRQLRRYDDALVSYARALALKIAKPEEVHLNRAIIFSDCLHRPYEAVQELTTALRLNAHYVPALLNLGNLYEDLGERASACAQYERILALDVNHAEALARIARLTQVRGADDPILARLRNTLASGHVSAADKASIGFALAKVLDDCGEYTQAFAACEQANQFSAQSAPPDQIRYDHAADAGYVDRLIACFIACFNGQGKTLALAQLPMPPPLPVPTRSPQPIFICGMFRSGSTLVERVLASHPRVRAGGELDFLPHAVRTALAPYPESLRRIAAEQLALLADDYSTQLNRLFPSADYVTDKRPDNYLHIGLIKTLFPDARIIHTVRNPLDVCLSIFFLHLDHSMSYALNLADIGRHYREYARLMTHWKTLYGDDILDFDYDTFVREPRSSLQRLLAFCNLEWDERCLHFEKSAGAVKTASAWQVREPLYTRSSGRWRHYAAYLAPLQLQLGDLCADFVC